MEYKDYVKSFEYNLIGEVSSETIKRYGKELHRFLNWLGDKEIERDTLERYKEHLKKQKYRASSINSKLACICKFTTYLAQIEMLKDTVKYKAIKVQRKELDNMPSVGDYKKMVNRAVREGDLTGACSMAIVFYMG